MRNYLLVFALALAACGGAKPDALTRAHGHEVALYVSPGVAGENNDLRVEVHGQGSARISEADVTMPDMNMPPLRIQLANNGNGSYSASNVHFSMAGTWHVTVGDAAFNVTVR